MWHCQSVFYHETPNILRNYILHTRKSRNSLYYICSKYVCSLSPWIILSKFQGKFLSSFPLNTHATGNCVRESGKNIYSLFLCIMMNMDGRGIQWTVKNQVFSIKSWGEKNPFFFKIKNWCFVSWQWSGGKLVLLYFIFLSQFFSILFFVILKNTYSFPLNSNVRSCHFPCKTKTYGMSFHIIQKASLAYFTIELDIIYAHNFFCFLGTCISYWIFFNESEENKQGKKFRGEKIAFQPWFNDLKLARDSIWRINLNNVMLFIILTVFRVQKQFGLLGDYFLWNLSGWIEEILLKKIGSQVRFPIRPDMFLDFFCGNEQDDRYTIVLL